MVYILIFISDFGHSDFEFYQLHRHPTIYPQNFTGDIAAGI